MRAPIRHAFQPCQPYLAISLAEWPGIANVDCTGHVQMLHANMLLHSDFCHALLFPTPHTMTFPTSQMSQPQHLSMHFCTLCTDPRQVTATYLECRWMTCLKKLYFRIAWMSGQSGPFCFLRRMCHQAADPSC